MRLNDIGLAVLVPLIWGVGFTLMKPLVASFPPLLFIAMVYGIIGLVVTPLAPRSSTSFAWMMLIALLAGSSQSGFLAIGLGSLPASTSNLLLQLTVPFTILLSWAARIELPSLRNGTGALIALCGVAVVIGAPGAITSWFGVAAITAGALTWSIAQILIRQHSKDGGATFYAAMARHAAPQALIASLLLERDQWPLLASASVGDWLGLVVMALTGFAGGYILWYQLLLRNRVDQLLPFTLLMPPIGVATSVLFLDESLHASLLIGGAIILAGLAVVAWPRRARALA